jgi:hypothetical protein
MFRAQPSAVTLQGVIDDLRSEAARAEIEAGRANPWGDRAVVESLELDGRDVHSARRARMIWNNRQAAEREVIDVAGRASGLDVSGTHMSFADIHCLVSLRADEAQIAWARGHAGRVSGAAPRGLEHENALFGFLVRVEAGLRFGEGKYPKVFRPSSSKLEFTDDGRRFADALAPCFVATRYCDGYFGGRAGDDRGVKRAIADFRAAIDAQLEHVERSDRLGAKNLNLGDHTQRILPNGDRRA